MESTSNRGQTVIEFVMSLVVLLAFIFGAAAFHEEAQKQIYKHRFTR